MTEETITNIHLVDCNRKNSVKNMLPQVMIEPASWNNVVEWWVET